MDIARQHEVVSRRNCRPKNGRRTRNFSINEIRELVEKEQVKWLINFPQFLEMRDEFTEKFISYWLWTHQNNNVLVNVLWFK